MSIALSDVFSASPLGDFESGSVAYVSYCPNPGTTTGVGVDACPQPADSLRIEIPATADRLSDIRRRLVAWLGEAGVSPSAASDMVLAVNEACSNCIEHAYRDSAAGVVQVEASTDEGRIVVCVTDFGEWQAPATGPTTRGRGLPIMAAMSNGVELLHSSTGTTVRMRFNVGAPAHEAHEWGSRTT